MHKKKISWYFINTTYKLFKFWIFVKKKFVYFKLNFFFYPGVWRGFLCFSVCCCLSGGGCVCGMNVRPGDSECRVPSLLSPPVLCNLFSVHLHAQLYASVHANSVTGLRKITLLHHSQLFADIVIMFTVYTNVHLCIMHSCTIVYTRFNRFSQCTLVCISCRDMHRVKLVQ